MAIPAARTANAVDPHALVPGTGGAALRAQRARPAQPTVLEGRTSLEPPREPQRDTIRGSTAHAAL
eukprot:6021133-Alexandrium_andersonii.AAC.1